MFVPSLGNHFFFFLLLIFFFFFKKYPASTLLNLISYVGFLLTGDEQHKPELKLT